MKNTLRFFVIITLLTASLSTVRAQYYQLANQVAQMAQTALSGSMNYRGFVDVSYNKSVGKNDADFIEVSTTQGFQYNSWFFMGVGLGIDGFFTHPKDNWGEGWSSNNAYNDYINHESTTSCVMLPLFTDFRFNFGSNQSTSFFADCRLGCAFLTGSKYMRINNGYLTNQQYFYLRPAVGVRIATTPKTHPKQAINVGITYQLLTSNYWYGNSRATTLNSLGVTAGFEW